MAGKPALRTELLFYLSFLAAFAILVGVATSLLALAAAPRQGVVFVVALVALEVGVFVLYGRSLVSRLVLRPLDRVRAAADAIAPRRSARSSGSSGSGPTPPGWRS